MPSRWQDLTKQIHCRGGVTMRTQRHLKDPAASPKYSAEIILSSCTWCATQQSQAVWHQGCWCALLLSSWPRTQNSSSCHGDVSSFTLSVVLNTRDRHSCTQPSCWVGAACLIPRLLGKEALSVGLLVSTGSKTRLVDTVLNLKCNLENKTTFVMEHSLKPILAQTQISIWNTNISKKLRMG